MSLFCYLDEEKRVYDIKRSLFRVSKRIDPRAYISVKFWDVNTLTNIANAFFPETFEVDIVSLVIDACYQKWMITLLIAGILTLKNVYHVSNEDLIKCAIFYDINPSNLTRGELVIEIMGKQSDMLIDIKAEEEQKEEQNSVPILIDIILKNSIL